MSTYVMASRPRSREVPEPIRMPSGRAWEHRLVLFETIGWGPVPCHWCGLVVGWDDGLQADHLDNNGLNNDPANLVPSCNACNVSRGKGMLAWRLRTIGAGWWHIDRALAAGPIKTSYPCGHAVRGNTYVNQKYDGIIEFTCLTCRRKKSLAYWREHQ